MRVLVFWEGRPQLALALDKGARDVGSFAPFAVRFLERPDDQGPHGCAGLSGALAQSVVQGLRDIYSYSRHGLIMPVSAQRL